MITADEPIAARLGALDALRLMSAVATVIMVVFLVYSITKVPSGIHAIMTVHDTITALTCGGLWLAIQRGRVRNAHITFVTTAMIMIIASNILLAMFLLRDPFLALYACVLAVGVGASVTIIGLGALVLFVLCASSSVVLFSVTTTGEAVRYSLLIASTSVVAVSLIVLRARNMRMLEHFSALETQQRRALKDALADLDSKVTLRTVELQQVNEALKIQIVERERAEREARQLSEQLLHAQRLDSLGRLAGGVAHDFNNLLTVIKGNLHLALEELPEGSVREPFEDAIRACERAGVLTHQLLAFGRKQVIERRVFDAGQQVEEIARLLQRVLGESIELQITVESRDLWVDADPHQIEQVLMNLAANARDAMPTGGVCTLEVGRVVVNGNGFVRLRVRDTGLGMDSETRERVFEPFFTTKEPGKGTGLGLATAYGVMKQHGGSITVLSAPGEGTTFDLLLPAVCAPNYSAPVVLALQAVGQGNETILLVEEEDAVRRVAERFLRRQGYHVLVAASGADAITMAEAFSRPIDLLFTDVLMPGMNGFELAARLRTRQPGLQVLFVSGYTGDYLEAHAGKLPSGTHFVHKPFDPASTARLIRSILGQETVHAG